MVYIGDYFALGLVMILFMFFFDRKVSLRHMPAASRLFVIALALTALTAVTDLLTIYLQEHTNTHIGLQMFVNTVYFIVNILATSTIALYLFTRILEHTYAQHCMKNARIGLAVVLGIYLAVVAANLWTGWLFYFDERDIYQRGPLNAFGYAVTIAQMVLVIICYARNRSVANRPIRRAMIQVFPVVPLCIAIQRIFPEVMLNSFLIAMAELVLFLTFQGQRHGVNALTELNDRHRFFSEVDNRIAQKEPFQVFLINIKNFGAVNQRYGHRFGDEALYHFAFALEKAIAGSICFHMNGTVFSIVLRYTYQATAEKQCGQLLDFLEHGIECLDTHVEFDYIVAHYVSSGQETTSSELFETMQYAVTQANGMKHRYIQCSHEDGKVVARRRYLQQRLRTVDRANGYEVWFQPIECHATGRFCSAEALVRLREPDGSLVSPAEFIPLAEQLGYISTVTWFVLEEVCRILKETPELGDLSVSVNMPMPQLLEKGFIPRFTGIVDKAGIPHRRICLEFTERAILENFEQTLSVMETLTAEGFRFYLDDFGTGYSNFNCLLKLPFTMIKLDTCILHAGENGSAEYTMVHVLTELFHKMDLTVIAEGAETQEEVTGLYEHGVDRIQGYALAKPMPIDKLLAFYDENPMRR
ncbi:MAG: EAL domain-containing protein [Oscillospiraceae bacterium]|nr:EAL domain-containing protein [Oscillospiraceae bacterium]